MNNPLGNMNTPKYVVASVTSTNDNTLVAAQTNYGIRCVYLWATVNVDQTIQFKSGTDLITPVMFASKAKGILMPPAPAWFETEVGSALVIDVSAETHIILGYVPVQRGDSQYAVFSTLNA